MWELVDKLGPWPILQIGVVTLIIMLSAMTYLRVIASKFPTPPTPPNNPQEVSLLYFQGWFKGVFDELQTLRANQEINRSHLREVIGEKLRETRHDLRSKMQEMVAEIVTENKEELRRTREDIIRDVRQVADEAVRELKEIVEEHAPRKTR